MAKLKRNRSNAKLQNGDAAPEAPTMVTQYNTPKLENENFTQHSGALSLDNYITSLKADKSLGEREVNRRIRKAGKIFGNTDRRIIVDKTDPAGGMTWRWEDSTMDEKRQAGVADIDQKGPFGGKGFAGLSGGGFEDILDDMISRGSVSFDTTTKQAPLVQPEPGLTSADEENISLEVNNEADALQKELAAIDKKRRDADAAKAAEEAAAKVNEKTGDGSIKETSTGGDGNLSSNNKESEQRRKELEKELGLDTSVDDPEIIDDFELGYVPTPEEEEYGLAKDLEYVNQLRELNKSRNYNTDKLIFPEKPRSSHLPEGMVEFFSPSFWKQDLEKLREHGDVFYLDANGKVVARRGHEYFTVPEKPKEYWKKRDGRSAVPYKGDTEELTPIVEGVYPVALEKIAKVHQKEFPTLLLTQDDKIIGKNKEGQWKLYNMYGGDYTTKWKDYTPTVNEIQNYKAAFNEKNQKVEKSSAAPPTTDNTAQQPKASKSPQAKINNADSAATVAPTSKAPAAVVNPSVPIVSDTTTNATTVNPTIAADTLTQQQEAPIVNNPQLNPITSKDLLPQTEEEKRKAEMRKKHDADMAKRKVYLEEQMKGVQPSTPDEEVPKGWEKGTWGVVTKYIPRDEINATIGSANFPSRAFSEARKKLIYNAYIRDRMMSQYNNPKKLQGGLLYKSGGKIPKHFWGALLQAAPAIFGAAKGLFGGKKKEGQADTTNAAPTAPSTGLNPGSGEMVTLELPMDIITQAIQNRGGQDGGGKGWDIASGLVNTAGNIAGGFSDDTGDGLFAQKGAKLKPKYQYPSGPIVENTPNIDYTYGFPQYRKSNVPAFDYDIPKVSYPTIGKDLFTGSRKGMPYGVNQWVGGSNPEIPRLTPRSLPPQMQAPQGPTQLQPLPEGYGQQAIYDDWVNRGGGGGKHQLDPKNIHEKNLKPFSGITGNGQTAWPSMAPIIEAIFNKPQSVEMPEKPMMNFTAGKQEVERGLNPDTLRMANKQFTEQQGRYRESADPRENILRAMQMDKAKTEFATNLAEADVGERLRTRQIARQDAEENRRRQEETKALNTATTYNNKLSAAESELNRKLAEQKRWGNLASGLYGSTMEGNQQNLAMKNYMNMKAYETGLQGKQDISKTAYQNYQDVLLKLKADDKYKDMDTETLKKNNPELAAAWEEYVGATNDINTYNQSSGQSMAEEYYKDNNVGTIGSLFNIFKKRKKQYGGKLLMKQGGSFAGPESAAIRAKSSLEIAKLREKGKRQDRKLIQRKIDLEREHMIKKFNAMYFNKLMLK